MLRVQLKEMLKEEVWIIPISLPPIAVNYRYSLVQCYPIYLSFLLSCFADILVNEECLEFMIYFYNLPLELITQL